MRAEMLVMLGSILLVAVCSSGAGAGERGTAMGPLRLSVPNPRYFTDGSQKAIYLTGSHTWANLQDMGTGDPPLKFDFSSYVKFMEAHGHNFMRMWVAEQARGVPWTSADVYVDPLPFTREGPGLALDRKPKFNLEKFNQKYFDRLRARIMEAGEHGIYVSVMLFNGWSIEKKGGAGNPWLGHPFNKSNNINGIDGDLNGDDEAIELYTLNEDPRIRASLVRQEAYAKKVIDTVNDLNNVLYEIANESRLSSVPWQYHMINVVKLYESTKPKQHPIGMTGLHEGGEPISNKSLYNSPADWISPNDSDPYMNDPPSSHASKIIISDTDHLWGIGGNYSWVWKSFLRGLNPIFMDPWEPIPATADPKNDPNFHEWTLLRRAMGDTLRFAQRVGLSAMVPRGELASSAYCLANPDREYLVYLPSDGHFGVKWFDRFHLHGWLNWFSKAMAWSQTVSVDLSGASKVFQVEWFNPRTGQTMSGGTTVGGGRQSFTAPFSADAVLYIVARSLED